MTRGENFLHNFISVLIFMAVTTVIMPGCSSDPKRVEIPSTADTQTELNSLGRSLDSAQAQQIDLLSPRNFGKSNEYYLKARKEIEKQKSKKETLQSIGMARAYLNLANESALRIRPSVSEVLATRNSIVNDSGAEISSKEITVVDNEFKEVAFDAEKARTTVPSDKAAALTNKYRDLRGGARDLGGVQF